ncbi:MAG: hypothetical protein ACMUIE_01445 [Thermoplasmatota archaeon]
MLAQRVERDARTGVEMLHEPNHPGRDGVLTEDKPQDRKQRLLVRSDGCPPENFGQT